MESTARLLAKWKSSPASAEEMACAVWPHAVGAKIAAHARAVKLVRSSLVVEVDDAVWRKQLFTLSAQIVARMRKTLGTDLVTDIEFRVAIPRRAPQRAESLASPSADEADQIVDPLFRRLYKASRRKATA